MNDLPNVHHTAIDEGTLDALLNDIAAFGREIEVSCKQHTYTHAANGYMSLVDAFSALRKKSIQAVQVRYTHEQGRWCDTFVQSVDGWTLTRINLLETTPA
jgi:hypothetical protein